MTKFTNTMPITDFINNAGASTMQIIRNPQNQGRFFVPNSWGHGVLVVCFTALERQDKPGFHQSLRL